LCCVFFYFGFVSAMVDVNIDNLRQSDLTKLPLHLGGVKDQFMAEQWIQRISRSCMASAWTANQTMAFVCNALRSNALCWFDALNAAASNATTGMPSKRPFLLLSAPLRLLGLPLSILPTFTKARMSRLSPSILGSSKPLTTLRLSLATPSLCPILHFP
jgi:hypothetical protein